MGLLGNDLVDVPKREMIIMKGQTACRADITFDIGGSQDRIIRKLVLKKTRSVGKQNSFKTEALLLKRNGARFDPVVNTPNLVNKEVESMLGLSAEAITKTVYIRQKEVDRLALADPKDLRDLITTLFGLMNSIE